MHFLNFIFFHKNDTVVVLIFDCDLSFVCLSISTFCFHRIQHFILDSLIVKRDKCKLEILSRISEIILSIVYFYLINVSMQMIESMYQY